MEHTKYATTVQLTEVPVPRDSEHELITPVHPDRLPASAWPREPVPLEPEKKVSVLLNLLDAVLIFLSSALIAKIGLVIAAWKSDSYLVDGYTDMASKLTIFLIEFNGQMVTAFTIIFVTIISTLVKRCALYKAQMGAYVSDLEQLQGSVSMVSTFKIIWSLRAFSFTSLGLVVTWSFYYLGSQSSQREYQYVNSASYSKLPLALPSSTLVSPFSPNWQPPSDGTPLDIDQLNTAYMYSDMVLGDPNRDPSVFGTDTAGNALVPDLKFISEPSPDQNATFWEPPARDHHGWSDVSKQSLLSQVAGRGYSAMAGATRFVANKDAAKGADANKIVGRYVFQTQYYDINCHAPVYHEIEAFPNDTLPTQAVSINMTEPRGDAPLDRQGNPLREFEVWSRWNVSTDPTSTTMTTNASLSAWTGSSSYLCNITQINVDVQIHCKASGCAPQKMRYRDGHSLDATTSYSTPFDNIDFAQNFFSHMLLIRGPQTNLTNPSSISSSIGGQFYAPSSQSVDGNDGTYTEDPMITNWITGGYQLQYERSLVKTINTYYILSQQQVGSLDNPDMDLVVKNGEDRGYYLAYLDGALYNPHYAISWPWIVVDFVSCLILLGAAIISTWLRLHTLAPDIFGYVSSLTRDNPHVELPNNGTTLNGIERALMLKKVKVKIGDVSAPEEPNRIGLARVDRGGHVRVQELRRSAEYV